MSENGATEGMQHGTLLFPCTFHDQWFDNFYTGEIPWHWHNDIELGIVTDGSLTVRDNDGTWTVHEGEGYFFNSGIMHEMGNCGTKGEGNGHLLSVVFDPGIISVISPAVMQYPRGLLLQPDIRWQEEILEKMKRLFITGTIKPFCYELSVLSVIADILFTIISKSETDVLRNQKAKQDGRKIMDETRIKAMLDFIRQHFNENISVGNIAAAANISESECYRIFKRILNTTPVNHLLDFRIRTAANMLIEEKKTISEICYSTGFNSPAYFTKAFHEYAGYTPKEFRNRLR